MEHTFFTGLQNQQNSFNNQATSFNNQPNSFNNQPTSFNNQPNSFNNQQPARQPQNNNNQQPLQTEAPIRQPIRTTLPPWSKQPTKKQNRPPTRDPTRAPIQSSEENQSDSNISCGKKETTVLSLVYGGEDSKRGDWPWLVAYYNNGKDTTGFICGASLVSANALVTAAHCIQNKGESYPRKAEQATFYIGKHNLNLLNEPGYISSGASKFNVHPSWNPNDDRYDADIAVVILLQTVRFSQYIVPICLWQTTVTSSLDVVDKKGTVVGWGKTEFDSVSSANPKEIEIPIVGDGVCLRSHDAYSKITSKRTFCAGKKDRKGPCNGGN